jgi:hypothetical protein
MILIDKLKQIETENSALIFGFETLREELNIENWGDAYYKLISVQNSVIEIGNYLSNPYIVKALEKRSSICEDLFYLNNFNSSNSDLDTMSELIGKISNSKSCKKNAEYLDLKLNMYKLQSQQGGLEAITGLGLFEIKAFQDLSKRLSSKTLN